MTDFKLVFIMITSFSLLFFFNNHFNLNLKQQFEEIFFNQHQSISPI